MKKYIAWFLIIVAVIGGAYGVLNRQKAEKVVITAPTMSYVALGDSVAAGAGLENDSDSSACDRTNQSYPFLVAKSLNYKLVNLACSEATLPNGISGTQEVNMLTLPSQLNQLFAQNRPDLISLTIGANDVGWISVIGKCYTATCGSAEDTSAVDARLNVMSANLTAALQQIKDHYGAAVPIVVVTGYHNVFPSTPKDCLDLAGIDANEITWARQQQEAIGLAIQDVVKGFSFARFVMPDFSSHELCTSDSWVQGSNDKQPYHPTAAGQEVYARAIVDLIKAAK